MPVATASARYLALPTKRCASPSTLAKITSSRSLDFVVETPFAVLLARYQRTRKCAVWQFFANARLPLLSVAGIYKVYIYVFFQLLYLFNSKFS